MNMGPKSDATVLTNSLLLSPFLFCFTFSERHSVVVIKLEVKCAKGIFQLRLPERERERETEREREILIGTCWLQALTLFAVCCWVAKLRGKMILARRKRNVKLSNDKKEIWIMKTVNVIVSPLFHNNKEISL